MDIVNLKVFTRLADAPISSCPFTSFKLLYRAVDADQENIEPSEKLAKLVTPSRKLDQ